MERGKRQQANSLDMSIQNLTQLPDDTSNFIPCYYCGAVATDREHVVPRQYIPNNNIMKVDSCKECNLLLGYTVQDSLQLRKDYLKEKLRIRYKKILTLPEWTEEELEEMEYNLRLHIEQGRRLKEIIKERLAW